MREIASPVSDEAKDYNRYDQSHGHECGILRILPPMFSVGALSERPSTRISGGT
jgi:hypothetical protein